MARYEWAWVSDTGGVFVECTDPQTVKLIIDEAKKIIPRCTINTIVKVAGEPYRLRLENLQNRDWEIASYSFMLLCHMGWEPYAYRKSEYADFSGHCLKLRKDS